MRSGTASSSSEDSSAGDASVLVLCDAWSCARKSILSVSVLGFGGLVSMILIASSSSRNEWKSSHVWLDETSSRKLKNKQRNRARSCLAKTQRINMTVISIPDAANGSARVLKSRRSSSIAVFENIESYLPARNSV